MRPILATTLAVIVIAFVLPTPSLTGEQPKEPSLVAGNKSAESPNIRSEAEDKEDKIAHRGTLFIIVGFVGAVCFGVLWFLMDGYSGGLIARLDFMHKLGHYDYLDKTPGISVGPDNWVAVLVDKHKKKIRKQDIYETIEKISICLVVVCIVMAIVGITMRVKPDLWT